MSPAERISPAERARRLGIPNVSGDTQPLAPRDPLRASEGFSPDDVVPELPTATFTRMGDVQSERVSWLWPGRIPRGKLTMVDGDPKTGKSTMLLDLAARVTTGSPLPDKVKLDGPANVVLLTAEDGLADTVRPRLDAAGADANRVVVFESVPVRGEDGASYGERLPSFPRDLTALEALVVQEDAVLVIIDVMNAYLGSDVDGYRDTDMRRALMPLAKMAERTSAAVVGLRHLTKSHTGNALYAGGGSIAYVGAARAVLLVAADPDDENRRVLAVTACNVAAPAPALGFELVPASEHDCARVQWNGTVEHQADDLVTPTSREERSDLADAVEWLRDFLAAQADAPAKDMENAARQKDISPRTLRRAKKQVGVISEKVGGAWRWRLPAESPVTPHDDDLGARCSQADLDGTE